MSKKTIYISGMTCASCESIIKSELEKLEGVSQVKVYLRKAKAEIIYSDSKINFTEVIDIIDKLGYKAALSKEELKAKKVFKIKNWLLAIVIVVALYFAYRLLLNLGLLDFISISEDNVSYGMAVLIGVVASLSTCLAVVGAVVISFSAKYSTKKSGFFQAKLKPQLLFHLGRIVSFFLLGGLLGLLGNIFNLSQNLMAVLTIFLAIVLVFLGLSILKIVSMPTILPKKLSYHWTKLQTADNAYVPVALGALSFFLPCGFTQSMQLFAIASGSFISGALLMLLFALGTLPVLMGVGLGASSSKNKKPITKKVIGLLVIVFAIYTMINGLTLIGVTVSMPGFNKAQSSEIRNKEAKASSKTQTINMTVSYSGYSPSVFYLKKDVPVEWIIDGQAVTGCTNEIISPALGIKQGLHRGKNVIKFTPNKAGTFGFSCWMGMVRGKFIIE